jgi:nucleoside 2-deoxyribosyltransferase
VGGHSHCSADIAHLEALCGLTLQDQPCLKDGIDYELFDMRDVARAGIIDNIMRAQIRDAAFVIVDLTHDNSGAYWEAGYAEGLGKPVIYICEQNKFEEAKTHFDTNHCTTVTWTPDDTESFKKQLVATLRRSLNLFPTNRRAGGDKTSSSNFFET